LHHPSRFSGKNGVLCQEKMVTALGKIGDPKAVQPLVEVLQDVTSNVRHEAALALGRIGDARALPVLERALKDDNKFVLEAAEGALQMLNEEGSRAVPLMR